MGLMDGLSALAGGVVNVIDDQQKEQVQQRRDEKQNELAMARAKAVAELQQQMAIDEELRKREQSANDAKSITEDSDNTRLSRIAGIINQREGSSMTPEDAKAIGANPEAMKAYGIVDRTRAQEYDDKIASAEKRGLMGSVKELRGQQDVELNREREDNKDKHQTEQDAIRNKQVDAQMEFNNRRADIQDRLAGIAEARAGRAEKRQGDQMDKEELRSTRLSLTSVLTDISKEADRIQVLRANTMDKTQTDLYDKQLEALRKDQTTARSRLNELAGVEPDAKAPPPAALNIGDVKDGFKFNGGDPKSKASWEKVGDKPTQAAQKANAEAKPQNFPYAGYADVQGAIDGAKRGDAKARELLPTLVNRGVTTPAQRKQIADITGTK